MATPPTSLSNRIGSALGVVGSTLSAVALAGWVTGAHLIDVIVPSTVGIVVASLALARAERQLDRARAARCEAQRERAAFDDSPIGALICSLDGRFERVNRAFCQMVDYTPQELTGRRFADLTHPDDRAADLRAIRELVAGTRRCYDVEKRYVRRHGGVVHVRVSVTTIYDADGRPSQFYTQVQDLTEGRRAARRLADAQVETLARLAAAAEYRDDETGEHTRRVGELAGRVAEELGLDAEQIALIHMTAPLHDVGKIGIPDSILLKPGRLDDAEYEQIKAHTTIGAQMLGGGGSSLLDTAEEIARTHHERWDGTGYPAGLAGEEIPIAGRIVAIVDVFDALTHDRPYKEAWSVDAALDEIERQRGRHFDPRVVDAFVATSGVRRVRSRTADDARVLQRA